MSKATETMTPEHTAAHDEHHDDHQEEEDQEQGQEDQSAVRTSPGLSAGIQACQPCRHIGAEPGQRSIGRQPARGGAAPGIDGTGLIRQSGGEVFTCRQSRLQPAT